MRKRRESNQEKRERIFNTYNTNWRLTKEKYANDYSTELEDAILCPLCRLFFFRKALNLNPDHPLYLTLEDIPPKSLGRKVLILTCKNCNNTAGHSLDKALKEFIDKKGFIDGEINSNVDVKTKIDFEGGSIQTSAVLSRIGEKKFEFLLNINKGELRHDLFEKLHEKRDVRVSIGFQTPPQRIVQIGLLRIAYLLVFQRFGHLFAFNDRYDGIRKQLANPKEEILESFGLINFQATEAPSGLYFCFEPEYLKSFVVVFELTSVDELTNVERKYKTVVLIPSPYIEASKFYSDFKKITDEKITFKRCSDTNFLTDPEHVIRWLHVFE